MKNLDTYLNNLFELDFLKEEYSTLDLLEKRLKNKQIFQEQLIPIITVIIFCANIVRMFIEYFMLVKSSKPDLPFEKKFKNILLELGENRGSKIVKIRSTAGEPNAFCSAGKNLFYTNTLKKMLTERELVAIMLHEYQHFKSVHNYINLISISTGNIINFIIWICMWGGGYVPLIMLLLMNSIFKISYDITIGRLMEYSSDGYAARSGYGDNLISALTKLKKYTEKRQEKMTKIGKVLYKIAEAIDIHPSFKNRFEYILKQKEKYEGSNVKENVKKLKNIVAKAFKIDPKELDKAIDDYI